MRVIFTGGGTAGHVNPAVAMAEILRSEKRSTQILFVARLGGGENTSIVNSGFDIRYIDVSGFKRKFTFENFSAFRKTVKAFHEAENIIENFKPDLIIGTGGYVSFPMLYAGHKKGVKTLIHESNAYPGLVTRLMQRKCDKVLLNLEYAKRYLDKKSDIEVIGNPLRDDFQRLNRDECRKELKLRDDDIFIVSFGGSGGAKKMNEVIMEVMKNYSCKNPKIKHIHSVGRRNYDSIKNNNKNFCNVLSAVKVIPYIENMPQMLISADIAITRCGAVTLSELAKSKVASILIPSPNVTGNHQVKNALAFKEKNAAMVIEEKDLTSEKLTEMIDKLVNSKYERMKLSDKISALHTPLVKQKFLKVVRDLESR